MMTFEIYISDENYDKSINSLLIFPKGRNYDERRARYILA